MMRAWTAIFTVSWSRDDLLCWIFCNIMHSYEPYLLMWWAFFMRQSIKYPRFLTNCISCVSMPPTFTVILLILLSCWAVPNTMNLALLSFSLSKVMHIQDLTSAMQSSSHCMLYSWASYIFSLKEMYICWSSAYSWYVMSSFLHILPRGTVYTVNIIGPCIDPWGTPYVSVTGSEHALSLVPRSPIATLWFFLWSRIQST